MKSLTPADFDDFFQAVHEHVPFEWQKMLLERVIDAKGDWPDRIDLPTASGKTACIDIAVFALAMGLRTPRRIWFVVDRRIVVDEAYVRAERLAQTLKDASEGIVLRVADALREMSGAAIPLAIARLRGGTRRDLAWTENPAQPTVLTSTIDQIGSRLLFRGYGVSDSAKPLHAAMAGNDSLIILDEAHLARPFLQTAASIEQFRRQPWAAQPVESPFKVVVMSATMPGDDNRGKPLVIFPPPAERAKALNDKILRDRTSAPKPTALALAAKPKAGKTARPLGDAVCEDELVLDAARRAIDFADAGCRRVAVMVNRVATARLIHEQLQRAYAPDEADGVHLLTGRLRPIDRDELVDELSPALKSGNKRDLAKPIIIVTTQCLEVGADFSFDALISECASLDALRQRFGRLSRLGEFPHAAGVILIRKSDVKPLAKLDDEKPADPIYGNAAVRTWHWLTADGATSIDMGINALQPRIDALVASGEMASLLAPTREAPILLPAYLDLWSQTGPQPAVEAEPALFLHGVPPPDHRSRMQVRVLWRNELADPRFWENDAAPAIDLIDATRPLAMEMLSIPLSDFKNVMRETPRPGEEIDDVEGGFEEDDDWRNQSHIMRAPFLIWRGADHSKVTKNIRDLRPDDVIILSARHPSAALLLPPGKAADVYDQAYAKTRGVAIVRYPASLGPGQQSDVDPDSEDLQELILQRLQAHIDGVATDDLRRRLIDPRLVAYSKTGQYWYLVERDAAKQAVATWETDTEDDQSICDPGGINELLAHTSAVVRAAEHLGRVLPAAYRSAIAAAARLHDLGKADPRFQCYLAGRRTRPAGAPLLAKSGKSRTPWQDREVRLQANLPADFRHEMLSMLLAERDSSIEASHRDLVLHLVAAHHGHARPFAPVVNDEQPPPVRVNDLTCSAQDRIQRPAHRLDSGVAERFWALTRLYGWWGLAFLEMVLRCADRHASAYAETQEGKA